MATASAGATAAGRVEPSFTETDHAADKEDKHDTEWGSVDDEHDASEINSNESGHDEYEPMTEDEMDAELDRIEAEEDDREEVGDGEEQNPPGTTPNDPKDNKA